MYQRGETLISAEKKKPNLKTYHLVKNETTPIFAIPKAMDILGSSSESGKLPAFFHKNTVKVHYDNDHVKSLWKTLL